MIDSFRGRYRFLSNFYPSPLEYNGTFFPTAEHAYQASKAMSPIDRDMIAALSKAGDAKRKGQKVRCRPDWDKVRVDIMREIVTAKFTNPDLRKRLLDTGDEELIEGNNWGDRFWGKVNGGGQNWLGRILMGIRDEQSRIPT